MMPISPVGSNNFSLQNVDFPKQENNSPYESYLRFEPSAICDSIFPNPSTNANFYFASNDRRFSDNDWCSDSSSSPQSHESYTINDGSPTFTPNLPCAFADQTFAAQNYNNFYATDTIYSNFPPPPMSPTTSHHTMSTFPIPIRSRGRPRHEDPPEVAITKETKEKLRQRQYAREYRKKQRSEYDELRRQNISQKHQIKAYVELVQEMTIKEKQREEKMRQMELENRKFMERIVQLEQALVVQHPCENEELSLDEFAEFAV